MMARTIPRETKGGGQEIYDLKGPNREGESQSLLW